MKYKIKTNIDTRGVAEDNILLKKYPFLNLIQKYQYDENLCMNYALNTDEDLSCTEAFEIIKRDYIQIPLEIAKEEDLIVYHDYNEIDDDEFVEHFAIIKEVNKTLDSIIIRSKWGRMGIYETNIYNVPNIYGNRITIWRKKK